MKSINLTKTYVLSSFFILLFCSTLFAQVGIGVKDPEGALDITSSNAGLVPPRVALTNTSAQAPVINPKSGVTTLADGTIVYNTNTNGTPPNNVSPGFYYWSSSAWIPLEQARPVESVSLTTDVLITGSTFTNVSGMSITFVARKSEAHINLTMSGLGFTGSLTFGSFRLYNSTTTSVIGGTNSSAQSLWKSGPNTYSITTWSASFSKKITGLTAGNSYTIVLQAKTDNLLGTDGVAIYPVTYPNTSHATITIIQ